MSDGELAAALGLSRLFETYPDEFRAARAAAKAMLARLPEAPERTLEPALMPDL